LIEPDSLCGMEDDITINGALNSYNLLVADNSEENYTK
jgi:hypothetical protein